MTRERKSIAHSYRAKENDVELPRERGADHERREKELENRIQCALEEVYEALLEAGREEDKNDALLDLELASELTH